MIEAKALWDAGEERPRVVNGMTLFRITKELMAEFSDCDFVCHACGRTQMQPGDFGALALVTSVKTNEFDGVPAMGIRALVCESCARRGPRFSAPTVAMIRRDTLRRWSKIPFLSARQP